VESLKKLIKDFKDFKNKQEQLQVFKFNTCILSNKQIDLCKSTAPSNKMLVDHKRLNYQPFQHIIARKLAHAQKGTC